jgi:hypothetical protein
MSFKLIVKLHQRLMLKSTKIGAKEAVQATKVFVSGPKTD